MSVFSRVWHQTKTAIGRESLRLEITCVTSPVRYRKGNAPGRMNCFALCFHVISPIWHLLGNAQSSELSHGKEDSLPLRFDTSEVTLYPEISSLNHNGVLPLRFGTTQVTSIPDGIILFVEQCFPSGLTPPR